jgi:UDPglucose--hexose-1-phosphate uridylyltransferase
MAKFVPDIKTQRWIVITPSRVSRPKDSSEERPAKSLCPFCIGNEDSTPPEILRVGEGEKNKSGWWIRVFPNKFPITDIHEVIVHSPDHDSDIEQFHVDHVAKLLTVYRSRFQAHLADGQVIVFCNHGLQAGASLEHPHSQLVVIPRQINLDALVREPVMNVVEDHTDYVMYCPDFSQWPYEVWIAPKKEETMFSDCTDDEVKSLAEMLQKALKKLKKKYLDFETVNVSGTKVFAYNYYIHHGKNWFIRIIPRLIHRAGFELGTGLSVNVIDPTIAARELQEISVE